MSINQHLSWLTTEIEELKSANLFRQPKVRKVTRPGWIEESGREYLDFSSNDYLGLAHHPAVIKAAILAAEEYGAGARASQLISGFTPIHQELSLKIAEFEQTEAAILFPSGYAANMGTIAALAGPEDLIICERNNHACLIDGSKLSGARLKIFHGDQLDKLEQLLKRETGYRRKFLITDTVFSMEGTIAPLTELCNLANQYDLTIIVDEAHATGILGSKGQGAVVECGLQDRIPIRIGTLSKAIGTQGGFVTGSQSLIDYLWNHARTQMFSTGLSPMVCASAIAAFNVIKTEHKLRNTLQSHLNMFMNMVHDAGINTLNHGKIPIIPFIMKTPEQTIIICDALKAVGFITGMIRPPTVPHNTSRIRISLSAVHEEQDIRLLAESIINLSKI